MWLKERLLAIKRRISLSLQKLSGHGKTAGHERIENEDGEDTRLEAEHRRCNTRTSIDSQVRHLWDAHYEPPRMDQLLQKHTLRTKKTEDVQRAKGEADKRNALIKKLSDYEGYRRIIVPFLAFIESDAYFKLRHPEEKNAGDKGEKDNSLDWYNGKQAGRLEVIEDCRLMVSTAISQIAMNQAREKMNADKQKERNEQTSE